MSDLRKCYDCSAPAAPGVTRCQKHRERSNARARAWSKRNPERMRELRKSRYARMKTDLNKARVLSRYGITPEQYDAMLAEQGGVCLLCGKPETVLGSGGDVKSLSVDHCHETGRIRGLLCNNCNRAIGLLGDDPELLIRAALYLSPVGLAS